MAKAPAKNEGKKPDETVEGEEPSKKKKIKLPLIIGLVVLLAGAGGGAWFFLGRNHGGEAAEQPAKPQPAKPPVFVPLDAFTVNLSSENEQYLQVAATLKVLDPGAADAAKLFMPEIRHKTLVLLSSKQASAISSGEGRERLAEELRQMTNNVLLAAAGKPTRPIVLDVAAAPAPDAAKAAADSPAEDPAKAGTDAAAEGATEDAAKAGTDARAAEKPPAPAAAPATTAARVLSKAAADDPVQSVFFTSFIIQ